MWLIVLYNERRTKKILNPESWPSMRTMPGSQKTYQGPSSTTALVITCDLRTPKKYMPDCAGYPIQDYPHLDYHIQHTLDSSVTMNHCFTLHIVKWRLRKWCQFFSTEKLASKILRLHKCAIFCHSYFIRAKLHPF